jgi:hypothetical protein
MRRRKSSLFWAFRRVTDTTLDTASFDAWFWMEHRYQTMALAFANIPSDRVLSQLLADEYRYIWALLWGLLHSLRMTEASSVEPC